MVLRRKLLAVGAAGATAILAGCSGDDGSSDGGGGSNGDDGDDGADDGPDGTDSERFGAALRPPESYSMEIEVETEEGVFEMSGRYHQGDLYTEFMQQGQQVELYYFDEESYFVFGGQCIQGTSQSGVDRETVDPAQYDPENSRSTDLEPTGTDTIDGEEVLVYEIDGGTTQGTVSYYVLADSGYPRRIEAPTGTWNFRNWNETSPIEPPDQNCQQAGG